MGFESESGSTNVHVLAGVIQGVLIVSEKKEQIEYQVFKDCQKFEVKNILLDIMNAISNEYD